MVCTFKLKRSFRKVGVKRAISGYYSRKMTIHHAKDNDAGQATQSNHDQDEHITRDPVGRLITCIVLELRVKGKFNADTCLMVSS